MKVIEIMDAEEGGDVTQESGRICIVAGEHGKTAEGDGAI